MRVSVVLPALALATALVLGSGLVASTGPQANLEAAPSGPGPYTGPSFAEIKDLLPVGTQPWTDDIHKQCGKYSLVFRNPDIREDANDRVYAEGQLFIQFQVVGPGSEAVTKLSFSFGKSSDLIDSENLRPVLNCNQSLPPNPVGQGTAGAYLYYYRSDFDPTDGFFVPVLTTNVPDGEYAAAVHAYEGNCDDPARKAECVEVARMWALAIVDNCPTPVSGTSTTNCPQSTQDEIRAMDGTTPWPIVLPGDGEREDGDRSLTIEFGEFIDKETLDVHVNGESVTMTAWENPYRDGDLVPDNDYQDCPNPPTGIRYVCERMDYGDGFRWDGPVDDDDVVKVQAKDLNGNLVTKTLHVGAPGFQALVDLNLPDLIMEVLNGDAAALHPGDFHEFNLLIQNVGGEDAHTNLILTTETSGGFRAFWADPVSKARTDHLVVPAGGEGRAKIVVETEGSTPEKLYVLDAVVEYEAGGQLIQKTVPLFVTVDESASAAHHAQHGAGLEDIDAEIVDDAADPQEDTGGKSPAPGFLIALLGLLGAAAVAARRRS